MQHRLHGLEFARAASFQIHPFLIERGGQRDQRQIGAREVDRRVDLRRPRVSAAVARTQRRLTLLDRELPCAERYGDDEDGRGENERTEPMRSIEDGGVSCLLYTSPSPRDS